MRLSVTNLVVLLALFSSAADSAEVPPVALGADDQREALSDPDRNVASNKRLVYDFIRTVLIAGRLDEAAHFLAPGYVQHSPGVPTGLDGFLQHMRNKGLPRKPIELAIKDPPLISIVGDGNLVVAAFIRTKSSPQGPQPYCHFDMFRVRDGRIVEHWDSNIP